MIFLAEIMHNKDEKFNLIIKALEEIKSVATCSPLGKAIRSFYSVNNATELVFFIDSIKKSVKLRC